MSHDRYCIECGRRVGQPRIHVAAVVALSILIGVCFIQIYIAGEENRRQVVEISTLNHQIGQLTGRVAALEVDLSRYKLRRPTYAELREFLETDRTDENRYRKDSYVCINFATDLKRSAARVGYNVSFISVNFESSDGDGGHALNGAYLSDGSWVWIEPQNDKIYSGTIIEYLKSFLKQSWIKVHELAITW